MPCGVIVHRRGNIKRIETHIAYLNSFDTTIMGSRNGQAVRREAFCLARALLTSSPTCARSQPLFMWLSIQKKGTAGFEKDAQVCVDRAKHLYDKMRGAGESRFHSLCSCCACVCFVDNLLLLQVSRRCSTSLATRW